MVGFLLTVVSVHFELQLEKLAGMSPLSGGRRDFIWRASSRSAETTVDPCPQV